MDLASQAVVVESRQLSPALQKFCEFLENYRRPGLMTPKEGNQVTIALIELLADGVVDKDMLKFAARFLTPEEYGEVITERNIFHLCGYPLCANDPKGVTSPHQINYHDPRTRRFSLSYLSTFCTREHYQASAFYQSQLSDLSIFSRKDITYLPYGTCDYELQTALLEEVKVISLNENKSLQQVIEEFKVLSVNDRSPEDAPQPPADPFLVGLSNEMKSVSLKERDISEPRLDAGDELLDTEQTDLVEGYKSMFRYESSH